MFPNSIHDYADIHDLSIEDDAGGARLVQPATDSKFLLHALT